MKDKKFKKFEELKEKYLKNPTKAKKEEVTKEVAKLIKKGWITRSMKIVYDFGLEKYRTMGLQSMKYKVYDKDKTIRVMLKQTYGEFLPQSPLDYIQGKELIFNPHEPLNFSKDGIEYANLFIKNKFLSHDSKGKRIDYIDWSKYKAITPLFENVFKTEDRMNFFVNWLAYGFQTLSKARTAIVSKGVQGTGKGVIFEQIIQYAVGENYTTIIDNEALKSRFNGELENRLFVLANEIKADFREGNATYERLKMYVTDKEIRFEEKNIKARTIPNFFNIWFHSNNDIPMQIQGSDRRYTVFNTKSKKLTEVSKELGYEHIQYFIEHIKEERDSFVYDIMSLNYDMQKATTPLDTEEKQNIYEASMSKIEILCDKIKNKDIEYFRENLEAFYNDDNSSNQDEFAKLKKEFATHNDFTKKISLEFEGNLISNSLSQYLYRIFVDKAKSDIAIGKAYNSHLGKGAKKKINSKSYRYRKIDEDKEVNTNVLAPEMARVEFEEPNGQTTIKNHVTNPIGSNPKAKKIIQDLEENGNLIIEDSRNPTIEDEEAIELL